MTLRPGAGHHGADRRLRSVTSFTPLRGSPHWQRSVAKAVGPLGRGVTLETSQPKGEVQAVNPTLAERFRRQQRLNYGTNHPPTPFRVTTEPPTALLHLRLSKPQSSQPAQALPGRSELIELGLELVLWLIDAIIACQDIVGNWLQQPSPPAVETMPISCRSIPLDDAAGAIIGPLTDAAHTSTTVMVPSEFSIRSPIANFL